MPYAIIRGENGRRHEVDFGDAPVRVQIYASEETVEIFIEADFETLPEERRRFGRDLPERGRIGIFNRSYYEEVLIVRVHPEILHSEGFGGRFSTFPATCLAKPPPQRRDAARLLALDPPVTSDVGTMADSRSGTGRSRF
jgi:Polyphosphate kinase 2 (PPK2)